MGSHAPDIWQNTVPFYIQTGIAFVWIGMIAGLPLIIMKIEGGNITRTQHYLFVVMWIIFLGGVVLFTNIIVFQSVHFEETRPLTIIECIYFLAQILTTVGYGDVTPAKPRGQVFV